MKNATVFGALALLAGGAALAAAPTAPLDEPVAALLAMHAPQAHFDAAKAPPAPDYSQRTAWAADGGGDSNMWGPPDQKLLYPESRKTAVFFIHPTTYFSSENWNQPIDDTATNTRTDQRVIKNQASVFNLCCRVYAPRYRQMTFSGFLQPSADSAAALDLAYSDVKRAFEYFLAHDGKKGPFIIASHSQGSRHAKRLIEEMIDGTPLAKRMVAAYVIGNWIDEDWFAKLKTVKPCETATDTGCVITWSSLLDGADGQIQRASFAARSGLPPDMANRKFVCTNPLTWSRSEALAPASLNLGGWVYGLRDKARPIDPHLVSARCENGALFVSEPAGIAYHLTVLPGGNYHTYDYQLAYMNIRKNAMDRANAWLARAH